jgi:hypothetical protein
MRTEGAESGPADRWCGSASETSIHVLRRSAELSCSPKQGKYRRMIEHAYQIQRAKRFYEEHGVILVNLPAQAEAINGRRKRRSPATSAQQAALDAGSHPDKAREKIWKDEAPPNLPPRVTRPSDRSSAILRRSGDARLPHRPSRIGCRHRDDMPEVTHRTSGQPAQSQPRARWDQSMRRAAKVGPSLGR